MDFNKKKSSRSILAGFLDVILNQFMELNIYIYTYTSPHQEYTFHPESGKLI